MARIPFGTWPLSRWPARRADEPRRGLLRREHLLCAAGVALVLAALVAHAGTAVGDAHRTAAQAPSHARILFVAEATCQMPAPRVAKASGPRLAPSSPALRRHEAPSQPGDCREPQGTGTASPSAWCAPWCVLVALLLWLAWPRARRCSPSPSPPLPSPAPGRVTGPTCTFGALAAKPPSAPPPLLRRSRQQGHPVSAWLLAIVAVASTSAAAAPAASTCTVVFLGANASVACAGPRGAVSLARPPSGIKLAGTGVRLEDPACVAMPRSMQDDIPSGTASVAMLRLCAAGPLTLSECRVSGVRVSPSNDSAVALSVVVSAGGLTLRDSVVEDVRGGTGVHLAAAGNISVLDSSFADNHAAAGNTSRGGGLAVVAAAGTRLVAFEGNQFRSDVAGRGGGAWVDMRAARPGARCVMAGANAFVRCQARSGVGGGIYLNASRTAGLAWDVGGSVAFTNNSGRSLFGTFEFTTAGNVSIAGTASFQGNAADFGGAAYLWFQHSTTGMATIAGSASFQSNTASRLGGGAVFLNFVASTAGTATVEGSASFQSNNATGFGGGAVYMDFRNSSAGTATVQGSASFQGNAANMSGGALHVDFDSASSGNSTIAGNVVFQQNFALVLSFGGAVHLQFKRSNASWAAIAGNARFQGNNASVAGGAVYASMEGSRNGKVRISGGARFLHNNASLLAGGAVYLYFDNSTASTATVTGKATFQDNTARAFGGALSLYFTACTASAATIMGGVSFLRNKALLGGGVSVGIYDSKTTSTAIAGSVKLQQNIASGAAGAAYMQVNGSDASNILIAGTATFLENTSDGFGGAVYFAVDNSTTSSVTIAGSTTFQRNAGAVGGAVAGGVNNVPGRNATVTGGNVSIAGSALFRQNNSTTMGGAVFLSINSSSTANISGSVTFIENVANSSGGAVVVAMHNVDAGTLHLQGAAFHRNRARYFGGALLAQANFSRLQTSMTIKDCSFEGNSAEQGGGGGASIVAGPPTKDGLTNLVLVNVSQTSFLDNVVRSGVGGGLHLDGTSFSLTTCDDTDIERCRASGELRDVQFRGNRATLGGGFYAINTQCTIRRAVFTNNSVAQSGGGFFAKGVTRLVLADVAFYNNRAIVDGGGLVTVLGDDFVQNVMVCRRCNFTGNRASTGGAVHQAGGQNAFFHSNVTRNTATQLGGGMVFQDICGEDLGGDDAAAASARQGTCRLAAGNGTVISGNAALAGGGVAVTSPGGRGVDAAALRRSARGNVARYGQDLAVAPSAGSLRVVSVTRSAVPSSTGERGATGLVVSTDQPDTRLQVEFCDIKQRGTAYLTGIENATVAAGAERAYQATFTDLRLMGGEPKTYCLRVFAPDFPLVEVRTFNLTVRGCGPGERYEAVGGCTPCPASRYSFTAVAAGAGECALCPTSASCAGGAALVPVQGFWHSAWNSSRLSQCPNEDACGGDRAALAACQARGPACAGSYWDKQCQRGYGGRLCMRCAPGYGSGTAFRCRRCMSSRRTALVLLLVSVAVCIVIACISLRSVYRDHSSGQARPLGAAARRAAWRTWPSRVLHDVEAADVFKVLVVYLQYVGILRNLVIAWPPPLRRLMDLGKGLFAPGSSDWVSLDCLVGGRAGQQPGGALSTWLRLVLTLAAVALAAGAACAADCLLPGAWSAVCGVAQRLRGAKPQRVRARERAPLLDVAVATVVVAVFTTYASLATTTLGAFACLDVDGEPYWSRDARLRCWRGAHLRGAVAPGVLCLLVVAAAVPTAAATLGRRRRRLAEAGAEAEVRHDRRYGFLYRLYRPSCRHWEAFLCLQTLALVAVDQFARQLGPLYQLVSVMVILLVSTAAWVVQRPLRSKALAWLYLAGMLTLMLTCQMMMLLLRGYRRASGSAAAGGGDDDGALQGSRRAAVAALMVLANALFVAACLGGMVHVGLAALFARDGWLRRTLGGRGCISAVSSACAAARAAADVMMAARHRSTAGGNGGTTRAHDGASPGPSTGSAVELIRTS